jgi:aspartyl aminopeptidase
MVLGFAIEHIRWIDCRYVPGGGFHVVAAHTDSPCPKLKPVAHGSKEGNMSVQVHMYGTGMWQTWFDRDLSIAGRVLMRRKGRELTHELVRVRRPMLHTPTLPIRGDSWKSDLEAQLAPLLAIQIEAELTISCESESSLPVEKHEHGIHVYPANGSSHHPLLLQLGLEI